MKIAVENLFKMANDIISSSVSNQTVMHVTMDVTMDETMHVTMDVSHITQSNKQNTVIKIFNRIQFYLDKFNIKSYVTTNHQLYISYPGTKFF